MKCVGSLVAFASLFCFATSAEIPPTWEICSRNDPNLSDCFGKSFEHALSRLKDGSKELGILRLEPMNLGNISVKGNPNNPVNLDQNLTNALTYNLTRSTIKTSRVLFNRNKFEAKVSFFNSDISVQGGYQLVGKVFGTPINVSGHGQIDFIDLEIIDTLIGKFYEKDGKRHIKLNDVTVRAVPTKITHKLNNPNADEKMLRDTEKLLDEKWDLIWEAVRSDYETGSAIILKTTFQAIFDTFSIDELFPA